MEDHAIIELFWQRDQGAIPAARNKYGPYCRKVAAGILPDRRDVEECLSDTWLSAWNAMPPQRPSILGAFLARISRNLAINRWQRTHAEKRGGGQLPLVLEELAECVSDREEVFEEVRARQLTEVLANFLEQLSEERRTVFLRRYWLGQPVKKIALDRAMLPGTVSMMLTRTRRELRDYLAERGFDL